MGSALEIAQQLASRFPESLSSPSEFRGEVSLVLKDASDLVKIMQAAKDQFAFDMLLDITSIDHLGSEPRFEMIYHLYSFTHAQYLRIKTKIGEENAEALSLTQIWKGAEWHEREVYDMMGIKFKNHPDLRRILMWEGYPYFPLRKEFPLAGKPVDEVVKPAPLAGGPFVTSPGEKTTVDREPRGKGETGSTV